MPYTEVMKARMIKRMTGPRALTASALAEETGITQPTLSRWLRGAGTVGLVSKTRPKAPPSASSTPKRAQDWTPQQKVQAVMEAAALSDEVLGAYLRRNGLHREQLDQWRQQVIEGATGALEQEASRRKRGPSPEQKQIRELERQLHRKDKALAETTALLVLKKKFDALFGDEEDDT